jgi:hypothetical protein
METNNQSAPEYLFDRVKELVRGWNEVSDKAGTLVREAATQGVHDRFAPRSSAFSLENNVVVRNIRGVPSVTRLKRGFWTLFRKFTLG